MEDDMKLFKDKKASEDAAREEKAAMPPDQDGQTPKDGACAPDHIEEAKDAPEEKAKEESPVSDLAPLLEASRQKAEEYLNLAQRVQADFDNYRRRNQSIRADAFEDGAKEFIKLLLPVVDNLERALAAESTDAAMRAGVELVYKQLSDILQKRGVTVIDRLGEKFDPNLENAVMQGTEDEGEKGTVCAVLQKGYKLGDAVLRHAMVKVVAE